MKTRKAAVLLYVLGMTLVLSALMIVIIEYTNYEMKIKSSNTAIQDLRQDAYSALNSAIAIIEEYRTIDKGLHSVDQGWGNPNEDNRIIAPKGGSIEIKITDECGKIPIKALMTKQDAFVKLFEYFGLSESEATEMFDLLKDWQDADEAKSTEGAEYDDYDRDNEAIPPNRDMLSFSELRFVKVFKDKLFDENGNPNEIYNAIYNSFTLENISAVNINSVSKETLALMFAATETTYDENIYDIIKGNGIGITDGVTWVKNSADITNRGGVVPQFPFVCDSAMQKIEIKVKRGVAEFTLCAYYGIENFLNVSARGNSQTGSNASSSTRGQSSSTSRSSTSAVSRAKASGSQRSTNSTSDASVIRIQENFTE